MMKPPSTPNKQCPVSHKYEEISVQHGTAIEFSKHFSRNDSDHGKKIDQADNNQDSGDCLFQCTPLSTV